MTGIRQPLDPPSASSSLHTLDEQSVFDCMRLLYTRLSEDMCESDLADVFIETVEPLLVDRHILLRLISGDRGVRTFTSGRGSLAADRRNTIELTTKTVTEYRLDPHELERLGFLIVKDYRESFEECRYGFDIPLFSEGEIAGTLCIESPGRDKHVDRDRRLVGQLAVLLSVSIRNVRLSQQTRYLQEYSSKLLDHAHAPIVVLGKKRDIKWVNRTFLRVTELQRDELIGQEFTALLSDADRPRFLPAFLDALRGSSTSTLEMTLPKAQGGSARISLNIASLMQMHDDAGTVIIIGQDMTEVRELEEQIVQAEKLATLGQLAAGVVHELNNPLTSITVYGEYLKQKYLRLGLEAKDAEKLDRIVQSANRILRFTRDLVTYARPSVEEPCRLSIHDALNQAIVFCEHILDEFGARIEKRYCSGEDVVFGVKSPLHQVFINLITNACHAMPEGAGHLVVATERTETQVVVRIIDNGSGIPRDIQDRIFEPFFTTKGQGVGTGLGLSIVRNILNQQGASISVRSELGEGTSFSIRLPLPSETRLKGSADTEVERKIQKPQGEL
ncbi:MAG: ATP-binding protein [Myxococcota bacterium]